MSNAKQLSPKLPDCEFDFILENIEGNMTRQRYDGTFRCKILTAKERARAGVRLGALNLGLSAFVEKEADAFNYMVSWLEQSLIESPDWWKKSEHGQNLYDTNIVGQIFNKVEKLQHEWYFKIWEKYPDNSRWDPEEQKVNNG